MSARQPAFRRECIGTAIRVAMSAPSGAHRQPWRFVVVDDPALKRRIREAAEQEERENYRHRFPEEWMEPLAPCGLFIAALHTMGLATLTHTPSPVGFLSDLLGRPTNEKPYILFPIGYPAEDAWVPAIERKAFEEVVQWNVAAR
jgi:nitroreductase